MRRLLVGLVRFRLGRLGQLMAIALAVAGLNGIATSEAVASASPLTVTTAATSYAVLGQPYLQQVTISGGTPPYYVTSLGGFPPDLTAPTAPSGNQANISGTPTQYGTYNITMTVTDSASPADTANVSGQIVVRAPVTIQSSVSADPVTGQGTTITATVAGQKQQTAGWPLDGPSGTMTFEDASGQVIPGCNNVTLQAALDPAPASCQLPGADAGTQSIQFVYSGDSEFAPQISGDTYQVQPDSTTTMVTASSTSATATVTANSPGAGAPTGKVTFSDASGTIGVATLTGGSPDTAGLVFPAALPAGSSTDITATYAGDGNFQGSQNSTSVNVPPLTLTPVTLLDATDGSLYSQQLSAGSGSYTYQVTTGSLPTGMSLSGDGLLSGTPSVVGSFAFTVTASDAAGDTGAQDYNLTVLAPPTITMKVVPASLVTGEPFSLVAQVSSPDATVAATGSISFQQGGGVPLGGCSNITLDANGEATCSLSGTNPGPVGVTLVYSGDGTYAPGSANSSFTVGQDGTSMTLSGTSTTLTATVGADAPGSGDPRGDVQFYEGKTLLGTVPLTVGSPSSAQYTLTTPLPAGSQNDFTASYAGGIDYGGSTADTSVSVPQLDVTPSTLAVGTEWSPYSAQLGATGGVGSPTYGFTLSSGSLPSGMTLSSSGVLAGTPTQAGTFSFAVTAGDTAGDTGTQQYTLDVGLPTVASVVSVSSGPTGAVYGQPVTLTATLTDPLAHFTPGGMVTFEQPGGTAIDGCANVPLSGDVASCTLGSATAGTHGVTVVYSGDAVYSKVSTGGGYAVGQAQSTTALMVDSGSLSATVKAIAPGTGTPSGTVDFLVGGQSVGVASLSSGTATLNYTPPAGQSVQVSAVYSGDNDFTGSSTEVTATGAAVAIVTPSMSAKPSITARVVSPAHPNRYGWYSQPVRVRFVCDTHGAELTQPCPAALTLRHNGGEQSVTRTIRTTTGGVATVVLHGINIDLSAPTVKLVGLRGGAVYTASPTPHCDAKDRVSGIASCRVTVTRQRSSSGLDLTVVRYTATATSRAGRTASGSKSITQLGIDLVGARYVHGRFLVVPGHSYEIRVNSAARPRYIDASPSPQAAAGADKWFVKVGEHSWLQVVMLPGELFTRFGSWELGVEIDGKLHQIPVAPAKL